MKAYEKLVVSTSPVGFNPEIFIVNRDKSQKATVTVTGGTIRYLTNGDDPSATKGLPAYDGDVLELEGFNDINLFRAIRVAVDVTLDADFS